MHDDVVVSAKLPLMLISAPTTESGVTGVLERVSDDVYMMMTLMLGDERGGERCKMHSMLLFLLPG
jgi:hypothetical protein